MPQDPIITQLQLLNISNIEGVRFFQNNGKPYSISLDSIKRMALFISKKYGKTTFSPGELVIERDYFVENLQSTLSTEDYKIIVDTLTRWVESGGSFEIIGSHTSGEAESTKNNYPSYLKSKIDGIFTNLRLLNTQKEYISPNTIDYLEKLIYSIPIKGIDIRKYLKWFGILLLAKFFLTKLTSFILPKFIGDILDFVLLILFFYIFILRWKDGKFWNKKALIIYIGLNILVVLLAIPLFIYEGNIIISLIYTLLLSPFIILMGSPHIIWDSLNDIFGRLFASPIFLAFICSLFAFIWYCMRIVFSQSINPTNMNNSNHE